MTDMDQNPSTAPSPEVMWELLGPMEREKVIVDGAEFYLDHPTDTKRLLDHPAVHSAFAKDEYMPYWTDLWPAARMLAKVIRRQKWTPGTEVLEIGCGLGLPGIVAMSVGLRVIFSDYDGCALRAAAQNAQLNGFSDFRCMQIDWRRPPDDLRVPVVLAADLVYEQRHLAPIAALIKKVLLPEGQCLLTDQDRIAPELIQQALRAEGLHFTAELVRAGEPQGRRLRGTLYRISTAPPT